MTPDDALSRRVLTVGPGRPVSAPSEAAKIARDGDVVEIAAALYEGDVAIWPQNDLTLRGVGGRAHVRASGPLAENKGIWVIKGGKATVESVRWERCRVGGRRGNEGAARAGRS